MVAFTYRCPVCVSGSLTSTVNITSIQSDVKVSSAFFDISGNFQQPVIKQRVTTLCTNGHTVVNDLNKLPDEVSRNPELYLG